MHFRAFQIAGIAALFFVTTVNFAPATATSKEKHRMTRAKSRNRSVPKVSNVSRTIGVYQREAAIVANLLCIHDGHSHSYLGNERNLLDPFSPSSYSTGSQRYWSTGAIDWGEGSWTTPGAGGLGMYSAFQDYYGAQFVHMYGYNNAGAWPAEDQLIAAEAAVIQQGDYHAWPNTRIPCGLG